MIRGVRPLHTVLNLFLMEKDQLTANFSRFGAGFILPSHLQNARDQLSTMKSLLDEVEEQKDTKKEKMYLNCGTCYKK